MGKEKLKKVAENIWEIPKEEDMNVPGIVFASDKLIEQISNDKTFEQVKNVAKLKGIVGKSIAMSDAHQGYGMSIGGVAAFDSKEGIISPGGVGYDVNCLTGESRVLTEFGSNIKIEDFGNLKSEIEIEESGRKLKKVVFNKLLKTINLNNKNLENKEVNLFMMRESDKVYEITLDSGLKVKATYDHPFLTKNGMIKLSELAPNQELSINTFQGVECEEEINREEAILAKVLGYMWGDGTLYESGERLHGACYGKREDLKDIQKDLESIKVSSKIYSRRRKHKIVTKYKENNFETTDHELHIHNKEFKELLKSKGMPIGNKTRQKTRIPQWIKNSNKIIKRLFLAGFFGAEMSTPKTNTKTCFFCPTLDQNKIEPLKENLRDFLIDISLLLEEFGINNTRISEMKDHKNKYGEDTIRCRLMISSEEEMLKLWGTIGFEYNKKRRKMADIASLYILLKKQENKKRVERALKIKRYKSRGLTLKEVKRLLSREINERFIERHYCEECGQRINLDFVSFSDFCKIKLEELSNFGCIFDRIKKIENVDGTHKVYDFNMKDNHNFIANGFIVSNCGVRLLASNLTKEEFLQKRKEIVHQIKRDVPAGVGHGTEIKLNDAEMKEILKEGVNWALNKGYATKDDVENIESNGKISGADPSKVSMKAIGRGRNQLGTLGSGNHFLEIQEVEEIYDEKTAKTFGLSKGQIVVLIHSGSRGVGHQVASDYIRAMEEEYGFEHLPDRELVSAPIESRLGKEYISAMAAAANFAFVNRQLMSYRVREAFKQFVPKTKLKLVYDLAHNIAKFEDHMVEGKKTCVCVHRKGATRSFGPKRAKELPKAYAKTGSPIFIPGSMGTCSYVLAGTDKAEELSFSSTAHGAGRVMSRTAAKKKLKIEEVKSNLEKENVYIEAGSNKGILEEAPEAYKDVNEVVRVSDELGIGRMVARLKPLGVIKG